MYRDADGPWGDDHPFAQIGFFQGAAGLDVAVVTQLTILQNGTGFYEATLADTGGAAQMYPCLQQAVASDADIGVDVGCGGIFQADTGILMFSVDPFTQPATCFGQLYTIIDSKTLTGIHQQCAGNGQTTLVGQRDAIGQIKFALGVAVVELVEQVEDQRRAEHKHAGVDFANGFFIGQSVFFFDDAADMILLPQNSAIAGGVVQQGGQHADGGLLLPVLCQQQLKAFAAQQRDIAA